MKKLIFNGKAAGVTLAVSPEDIACLMKGPDGSTGVQVRGDRDIQSIDAIYSAVRAVLENHGVEFVDCTDLPRVPSADENEDENPIEGILRRLLANPELRGNVTAAIIGGKLPEDQPAEGPEPNA